MKFKKSDLKRIIAEELTRSSELRRFLSERGEIKPGTIKQNQWLIDRESNKNKGNLLNQCFCSMLLL